MTMEGTTLKRHPIRGFLWGLITGAGVCLLLMVFSIIPLAIPTLIISGIQQTATTFVPIGNFKKMG